MENKKNANREFTFDLGYKLRTVRECLNLNATEASKKFNISIGQIANYENGKENPNLLYVCNLMNECGLKAEDLLLDTNEFMKKIWFK